jgi:IS30 family transposase
MKKSSYTQLTYEERYHIYLMKKRGESLRSIGISMGRSYTTISRELIRNTGKRNYRYKQAHESACQRHKEKEKCIKLTLVVIAYIKDGLKQLWSPEQVCGRLLLEHDSSISPETIYRFILKDKQDGGELYRSLRCQSKRYRKR